MNNCWGGTVRKSSFTCCNNVLSKFIERESKTHYCTERVYTCGTCKKEKIFIESTYSQGSWILK